MYNTDQQASEMVKLFGAWLETSRQFWQSTGVDSGKKNNGHNFAFPFTATEEEVDDRCKAYRTWETAVNSYLSFVKLIITPQSRQGLFKGFSTYMEAVIEAAGDSLENFTEFQSQLIKSCATVGECVKLSNFNDLNHASFEAFRELYRSEFQKYFNIPKIGLPREFHEQLSSLVDKSYLYYSHLVELIYLFSVPLEKTNRVMQQKIKYMLEKGEFPEDYKEAYTEWIKILEGHYMEMLKSPEYTHVLNDFIGSLAAYKNVRNEVINSSLKDLQIPTNKEMDAVYSDIYQMKKKIRQLANQVEILQMKLIA
jgi:class III poly(R)-hydroxyalkanoic acid synthase PhaE subunit